MPTKAVASPSSSSHADRRPSVVINRSSFHNAIVTLAAIGGSTNAVIHLLAIAGRLGVELTLDDFDRIGADVPVLVDLLPAGRFLMEDLHRAGGLHAVLSEVLELLDPDAASVTGKPFADHVAGAQSGIGRSSGLATIPSWPTAASPFFEATSPPRVP